MPLTGIAPIVTIAGSGVGPPDHFNVDTDDDYPRPGQTGTFYAQLVDAPGNCIGQADVAIVWTLQQNGGTVTAGATLTYSDAVTDANGRGTATVLYDAGATVDDYYTLEAVIG